MTEMGAYGLVASNGFTEAVTGRDMFGNKVSEEKRKQALIHYDQPIWPDCPLQPNSAQLPVPLASASPQTLCFRTYHGL